MGGDYFPVPLSAMKADLEFQATTDELTLGPTKLQSFHLPHPGGCLGFRLEAGGSVFVLATDCELDQVARNKDELRINHRASRQYDPGLLHFLKDANLLVIDCQFTDEDYQQRSGWGHNSLSTVVDLCAQAHPDMVALFHHDPQSTDDKVTNIVEETVSRLRSLDVHDTLVFAAREGLTMTVETPRRPTQLPE